MSSAFGFRASREIPAHDGANAGATRKAPFREVRESASTEFR